MTSAQQSKRAQVKVIYSAEQIQARIKELGKQISKDYSGVDKPVVIGVMKGAICFLADLLREVKIDQPMQVEFVRLASYGAATESSGTVQAPYLDLPNLYQRNIIVVEDIVDSGRTAHFFMNYLKDQFDPKSLKLACFLDKPSRRAVEFTADYVGFTIEDLFVIGYGLDYNENYRELPYLGEYTP